MGGGKGGSSDQSGMYMAMASAQAAQQAYALGGQQLDWAKTQWNQQLPYMTQIAQGQINTQNQLADFSRDQESFYKSQYQPMEADLNKKITDWASPQNIALQSGQASANVAEAINAQKASASSQLEGYGVNPGSGRFASLGAAMGVQGGAAEAGAGTAAGIATKMQGMELMGQAVNTGRGFPNAVAGLSGTGSQAGAAGASGMTNFLGTGSNMMSAPTAWWNAGAQNMGVYVGAVNGYNQTQAQFAQANAMEMAGIGSAVGGIAGAAMFHPWTAEKGGPVGFDGGGLVDEEGLGGGFAEGFNASMRMGNSLRTAQTMRAMRAAMPSPPPRPTGLAGGGIAIPSRYFQVGPATQQPQPQQPQGQQPPPPIPPQNGTPGGVITPQMSPSQGQVPDDVDAKLTVGEFVMPLDVVRFKGKEYFYKQIDSARKQEAMQSSRGDIGGEPSAGIPSRNPQFVSRPNTMAMPVQGMPQGIPMRGMQYGGPTVPEENIYKPDDPEPFNDPLFSRYMRANPPQSSTVPRYHRSTVAPAGPKAMYT
jgi:hypothetical protein